ncbi:hypothetical protein EV121DRAFT_204460 [Schizophyllum commune]
MHITLLIICLLHLEENVVVPITDNNSFGDLTSTAVTVSATLFATFYGALLIWMTQRLALRRLLTSQQTLTAMHDEYNSWIGLGSALMTLYGQTRIRSAVGSISCITSYLVNAAILHVTIPAMFSLQVGTLLHSADVTSLAAYPRVDHIFENSDNHLLGTLLSDASSLLPYVALTDAHQTVGLDGATMYDQLLVTDGNGTVFLEATTFNVTCGTLNDLTFVEEKVTPEDNRLPTYNVSHVYPNGTLQTNVVLKYIYLNNTMVVGFRSKGPFDSTPDLNRTFYLYGTFDLEDSAGALVPNLTLTYGRTTTNITIVGCDLYSYNHTVEVSRTTRLALDGQIPPLRESSSLSVWQPQDAVEPEDLNILDLWSTGVQSQYTTSDYYGGSNRLGFMEKYLITCLDLDLNKDALGDARGRVLLSEVENALSRLAASYFWSFNQVNKQDRYSIRREKTVPVTCPEVVLRLHLSPVPVLVGLIVSLFLMLTNALLVRPRESRTVGAVDVLDSLGLLQIIWFVRGRPEVLSTIGRVENPNDDDLRLVGMFVMHPDVRAPLRPYGGEAAFVQGQLSSEPSTPTYKWQEDDNQLSPTPTLSGSEWANQKLYEEPSSCVSFIYTWDMHAAASPPRGPRPQLSWDSVQAVAGNFVASLSENFRQARFLRRLSYAMHMILVLTHVTLLVVCLLHLEENVVVQLSDDSFGDLTSTAVTVSATIFATIYGALLIWMTQRLALRRLLTSQQTLTAMHDEFNSWIGLGSALMTLYGQSRIRSTIGSISLITSYLVNAAILHVTIPAMFSLQVGTQLQPAEVISLAAYPRIDHMFSTMADRTNTEGHLLTTLLSDASSLLPYVALSEAHQTVGLDGATMYDQLLVNDGNGTVSLEATTFNVTCGTLNDLTIVSDGRKGDESTIPEYNITHQYPNGTQQANVVLKYIYLNNTMVLGFRKKSTYDPSPGLNRTFYLYGSFDLEDSAGTQLPNFTLPYGRLSTNISIVGCDLYSHNHTVEVSRTTRLALDGQIPPLRTSSTFSAWQPQDPVAPEDLNILDLWSTGVQSQYTTSDYYGGSNRLGFMEKYLITCLDLDLKKGGQVARGRVGLSDVENALSRLAASYFWSFNQVNKQDRYSIRREMKTPVTRPEVVLRLHLSPVPVLAGLIVSLFLMMTNALLVRPRESRTVGAVDVLDSLGLLQIIWFVRGRPEVLSTIGRVEDPNEDDLRLVGMFVMQPDVRASLQPFSGQAAFAQGHLSSEPSTPTYKWTEDDTQLSPTPTLSHSDWANHKEYEEPSR